MGKPKRINLPFKCEPSSMGFELDLFPNNDVDYINIRSEPYYYSALTITLLSAKKKKEELVMHRLSSLAL